MTANLHSAPNGFASLQPIGISIDIFPDQTCAKAAFSGVGEAGISNVSSKMNTSPKVGMFAVIMRAKAAPAPTATAKPAATLKPVSVSKPSTSPKPGGASATDCTKGAHGSTNAGCNGPAPEPVPGSNTCQGTAHGSTNAGC